MATKRVQKNRKNSTGGFDVIHYETDAAVTYMEDGRTVEDAISELADGLPEEGAYIKRAGDTMNGPLTLAEDPTGSLQAATKQYVDKVAGQTQVGAKGEQGDPGPKGDNGEDGGYYSPALDATGTLSWSPSKADMPAIASVNIKGPQGETGPKGETGATGPTGAAGKDGVTPQKGVDYWTEEDKAEILEELGGAGVSDDVVLKTGDTMTGPLVLSADPTEALEAATKQYVDEVAGQTQVGAKGEQGDPGPKGDNGEDGGYYIPSVDEQGVLSWTSSKTDMPAVDPVNIKGPQGETGPAGAGGNIHVLDIGAETFNLTTMDFSAYCAGDVILMVADMDGGAAS